MTRVSFVLAGFPFRAWSACSLLFAAAGCSGEGTLDRGSNVPAALDAVPGAGAESSDAPSDAEDALPSGADGGDGFELWWQDDFDSLDASRWQLMTHSWDTNLAQFSTQNTRFEDGLLSLLLTPEAGDAAKPFRGVEMRSVDTLTYGKVEARARLAGGSGVVSALVLIYTPWPADDWNELDIEYLGRYSDRVQFNAMVYTGAPTAPPVAQSVTPTPFPELAELAFDPSADFHVYGMEWTPTEARFTVDGAVLHAWNGQIDRLKLPMNILLTIWASSAAGWAGPIPEVSEPITADYDWIRVYRWTEG